MVLLVDMAGFLVDRDGTARLKGCPIDGLICTLLAIEIDFQLCVQFRRA